MLLQFTIKNIGSFKNETTFDLTATSIQDHNYSLIDAGGVNVLPVATIYGPNASGKTNLIKALINGVRLILESVSAPSLNSFVMPYIFDEKARQENSSFEIVLACSNGDSVYEYCYGYTLNINKICSEHLYFKKPTNESYVKIYTWDETDGLSIGRSGIITSSEKKNLSFCNSIKKEKELLLSLLGLRDEKSNDMTCFGIIMREIKKISPFPRYGVRENHRMIFSESEDEVNKVYNQTRISDETLSFIRKADPTIDNIKIYDSEDDKTKKILTTVHGNMIVDAAFESGGTNNMIFAYPRIRKVLDEGGVLVADEIDAQLHPMLLQYVISMFMNPDTNPNHAQLISTLHNVVIMDKRNLRRDSIYFVEKDEENSSKIYSLSDVEINNHKVRNDADYCKQYLLGMYGAIPKFEMDVMNNE